MTDARLLEELRAERDIQQIILRYAHGIDRLDFETVRGCFHPDARIVYGGLADGAREETLAWLEKTLPTLAGTTHFFGAPRILLDLDAGRAETETYSLNAMRAAPDGDGPVRVTYASARYLDRFEMRDGAWRIARRELLRDWTQHVVEVPDPTLPSVAVSAPETAHPHPDAAQDDIEGGVGESGRDGRGKSG